MSSSLLLQQCPACLVRLTHIYIYIYTYLPTPPLGQDMTQGQFLICIYIYIYIIIRHHRVDYLFAIRAIFKIEPGVNHTGAWSS